MPLKFTEKFSTGRVLLILYCLVCIVVGYNIFPIMELSNKSISRYHEILSTSTRKLELMNKLRKNVNNIQSAQFKHVLAYSASLMHLEEEKLSRALLDNDTILSEFGRLVETKEEQGLLDEVLETRKINAATRAELIRLSASSDRQMAFDYYVARQEDSRIHYSNAVEELMTYIVTHTYKEINATERFIKKERDNINLLLSLSVILIILTGTMVLSANKKLNRQNELLLQQEKKYHTIVETTDEMIFLVKPDGKIAWTNRAFRENLGYSNEDLTGFRFQELIVSNDKPKVIPSNQPVAGIKEVAEMLVTWSGEKIYVEGKVLVSKMGDLPGVSQYFIRNVTDKKKAEELLQSTTTQLQRVLNIFDNSFWGSDVIRNKMIYVSPGNEKVFGYPEQDFMEDSELWFRISAEEDIPKFSESMEILRQGKLASIVFRINHPQKGQRWIETKMVPTLDENNILVRVDGMAIDITDRKKSEDELVQNYAELKKINSELDRFVYSTSHDLRAPLLNLEGLINLAEEHIRSEAEIRQFLAIMRETVSGMDDTIKDILEYSRNARTTLASENLNVEEMIRSAVTHSSHRRGRDKIKCTVKVSQPAPFFSDRLRVSAVINNLVSNAYKFSREDEPNPAIGITFASDTKEGILSVEDNGEGIPEEYRERIFEMFTRASEKSEGSGLGLYICKEIVQRLKGSIEVDSVPGRGSTFRVRIPNLTEKNQEA